MDTMNKAVAKNFITLLEMAHTLEVINCWRLYISS